MTIKPWTTREAYTAADWLNLISVAELVQNSSAPDVTAALQEFDRKTAATTQPSVDYLPSSRILLLLRVAFTYESGRDVGFAGGWLGEDETEDADRDAGWPVRWSNDVPALTADYAGF